MWHKRLMNPQAISSLFEAVPVLNCVRIKKLIISEVGPQLSIHIDLPRFPDFPPEKWFGMAYNKVHIQLDLFEISSLRISGWGVTNIASVEISDDGNGLLRFAAEGRRFSLSCGLFAARISRIAGYLDDNDD